MGNKNSLSKTMPPFIFFLLFLSLFWFIGCINSQGKTIVIQSPDDLNGITGSGYIRTDGTSTTTANIPFLNGLTSNGFVIFKDSEGTPLYSFSNEGTAEFYGETQHSGNLSVTTGIPMMFGDAQQKIWTDSTYPYGNLNLGFTEENDSNFLIWTTEHVFDNPSKLITKFTKNQVDFNVPITTPQDMNASRFCLSDGNCFSILPNVTVFSQVTAKTVTSSGLTTTNTSIISNGIGTTLLPANFLQVGRVIRLKARGTFTTPITPPTLTLVATIGSTTYAATPAFTPTKSLTSAGWEIEIDATTTSIGGTGTVIGQGRMMIATSVSDGQQVFMPTTSSTTINTLVPLNVDLNAQWATGIEASITVYNLTIEALR